MDRYDQDTPLPEGMQGRWTDVEDPKGELVIQGGQVIFLGQPVTYDYKLMGQQDNAVVVSLKINVSEAEDAFQKDSITELVITPEGDFHGYNVRFASRFIRDED